VNNMTHQLIQTNTEPGTAYLRDLDATHPRVADAAIMLCRQSGARPTCNCQDDGRFNRRDQSCEARYRQAASAIAAEATGCKS
jgi:hypothetical protein